MGAHPFSGRGHARSARGPVVARAAGLLAAAALLGATPAPARAVSTVPQGLSKLGLRIPAGANTHGTASTSTTTTPTTNGAQPGTVAPGSTVGGGSVPTTTATVPTTTLPSTSTPGETTVPTTVAPAGTLARGDLLGSTAVRRSRRTSKRLSGTAIALAALGALLLLACLLWGVARQLALEPRWANSLTYSLREAGYHASATWAEFSDWARIGH